MAGNHNVSLTEQDYQFVARQVEAGNFQSPAEVIIAGLRLLEVQSREDAKKIAVLRKLVQEGIDELDAGKGVRLEGPEEIRAYIDELGRRASERVRRKCMMYC